VGVKGFQAQVEKREMRRMRKRVRVLILAAIVAAVVVPVGFALSLDSRSSVVGVAPSSVVASSGAAPLMIDTGAPSFLSDVPDAAKLLVVGTVLFGLAAAVRRAA
jgi:hypothetical protein